MPLGALLASPPPLLGKCGPALAWIWQLVLSGYAVIRWQSYKILCLAMWSYVLYKTFLSLKHRPRPDLPPEEVIRMMEQFRRDASDPELQGDSEEEALDI